MNRLTSVLIFVKSSSLQDFVDAFEKLLRLELKSKQEREIVTVILECSAGESQYNAYYTHLLSKFLTYHRNYLVSVILCAIVSVCDVLHMRIWEFLVSI